MIEELKKNMKEIDDYKLNVIDDEFEAWAHGPVCPTVYQEYKRYGFNLINAQMTEDEAQEIVNQYRDRYKESTMSDKMDLVDAVFDKYGQMTSLQLEMLTHQEEPWIEARKGLSPIDTGNRIISDETMKRFYGNAN